MIPYASWSLAMSLNRLRYLSQVELQVLTGEEDYPGVPASLQAQMSVWVRYGERTWSQGPWAAYGCSSVAKAPSTPVDTKVMAVSPLMLL